MEWKSSIDLMFEDGKQLQRLYEKGWISPETFIKYLSPLVAEIEVWRGLERMEEAVAGPRYCLSGIEEQLAMTQLLSAHKLSKGGYVI